METDRSPRSSMIQESAAPAARNRLVAAPVRPIRVPLALGSARSGVEQGAAVLDSALCARFSRPKRARLASRLEPSQSVAVAQVEELTGRTKPGAAMFLPEIAAASVELAGRVRAAIESGALALTLGGDHAVSIGSIAGAAAASQRLAVLWIDAHADLNWPEVSPSGHVHGMPLGVSLGRGPAELTRLCGHPHPRVPKVRPEDTYLLGIRDLDPGERDWIAEGEIHCLTMPQVDALGFEAALHDILDHIGRSGIDALHVSFDLDVLDPSLLPGTGTPEWGGLTFREAARLLWLLREADLPIRSLDWVELNPTLDPGGTSTSVATELLAIALGEEPF